MTRLLNFFLVILLISNVFFLPAVIAGQEAVSDLEQENLFLGKITADNVNIRSGYNKNFNSIASLKKDELVVVTEKKFSWYKIILPPKANCYIHGDFIELLNNKEALVTANRLNVRGGPDVKFGLLGQLKKGEHILIKEKKGDWYKIFPTDILSGWIYEDYIENIGDAKEFLKRKDFLKEFEVKLEEINANYRKSAEFSSDVIPALNNSLKDIRNLKNEYGEYADLTARLSETETAILAEIDRLNRPKVEVACQSEETGAFNGSPAEEIIEVEGMVEDLGIFWGRKGTHKLISHSQTTFYLESDSVDLNYFSGCAVRIRGTVQSCAEDVSIPLLKIENISLI